MALLKENIVPINVAEEMSKSFLDYSMSVIISRALPDARDGLKPSQRRILYAMDGLGVQPNRKHVKCAKIVRVKITHRFTRTATWPFIRPW